MHYFSLATKSTRQTVSSWSSTVLQPVWSRFLRQSNQKNDDNNKHNAVEADKTHTEHEPLLDGSKTVHGYHIVIDLENIEQQCEIGIERSASAGCANGGVVDTVREQTGWTREQYFNDLVVFGSALSDTSETRCRKRVDRDQLLRKNQFLGVEDTIEIDFEKPFCVEEYRALFCKHKPVGDPDVLKEYNEHMRSLGCDIDVDVDVGVGAGVDDGRNKY